MRRPHCQKCQLYLFRVRGLRRMRFQVGWSSAPRISEVFNRAGDLADHVISACFVRCDLNLQPSAKLNWKSLATIVKRAVRYGLKHRRRPPVHVIGIDEVSRRKGQVYLTLVYDLERRVLLWVGDDRTEEAVRPFFN